MLKISKNKSIIDKTMEKTLKDNIIEKIKEFICPSCKSNTTISLYPRHIVAECSNQNCSKRWILQLDKKNSIKNAVALNEIKALIEFYLELPFNLGLPSGNYAFDKPNQMRLIRHMYYFQSGNEIENLSSIKGLLISQDKSYDENGLMHEKFLEYNYKRKMKTVLFKKYPIRLFLTINIQKFISKLKQGLNLYDIFEEENLDNEILEAQNQFHEEVNIFLKFYSMYFPINDIDNNYQHEVRSISKYEFNQSLSFGHLIIEDYYISLKRIIKDFTNFSGIPDVTFTNKKKIEYFEKLIQNRKLYNILPYQEIFNLARSLYRTNKMHMAATIIVNSMIAFESILNKLENIDKNFKTSQKKRVNLKLKSKKKSIPILFYYFQDKPKILEIFLNKFYPNKKNLIFTLNYGRLIRNQIVHDGIINYNHRTDKIKFFLNRKKTKKKVISFTELWESFLLSYDSLNKYILKIIYPKINWSLDNNCKKEKLLMFLPMEIKKRKVLPIPNYDWREIYSHNMKLPTSAVPPDKLPILIETTDGKGINLSLDFNKRQYEIVDQKKFENGNLEIPWYIQHVTITSEEFFELKEQKSLKIPINLEGHIFFYRSCPNCDYIIPLHQNISCNNNRCKKCNFEFDLNDYAKEMWHISGLHELKSRNYLEAIKFINNALDIDPHHKEAWNDKGYCLNKLEEYNKALFCFNNSLQEDRNYKKALHNKSAVLIRLKRYIEAEVCCDKLIKIDIQYAGAYYNKACIKSLNNKKSEALFFLKKSIELNEVLKKEALSDPDFNNIKDLKEFKDLIGNNNKN